MRSTKNKTKTNKKATETACPKGCQICRSLLAVKSKPVESVYTCEIFTNLSFDIDITNKKLSSQLDKLADSVKLHKKFKLHHVTYHVYSFAERTEILMDSSDGIAADYYAVAYPEFSSGDPFTEEAMDRINSIIGEMMLKNEKLFNRAGKRIANATDALYCVETV